MKRHELTEEDVTRIFRDPYIIGLASCVRSDRSKSLECHIDLEDLSRTKFVVLVVINGTSIVCETTSKEFAVARYNEVDV